MQTLLEFASDEMLIKLLIKERAKCRRRNRGDKSHKLDKTCSIDELTTRKLLSRIMPPRYTWVRPSKRPKLENGAGDTSKDTQKALLLTICRDRKMQKTEGRSFAYLDELDAYVNRIRERLSAEGGLSFEPPHLMPIFKSAERQDDGRLKVTCRPLATYTSLEDKIILALTSRYLTRYFNLFLHENILSYRPARPFLDKVHYVTDFNDGARLIEKFRVEHNGQTIYAADCDIKKFYDIIPHKIVRECFSRLLDQSTLSSEGKTQVMRVLEAYLQSYNFYTNAWLEAKENDAVFAKVRRKLHDKDNYNKYELGWVDEVMALPIEERKQLGVPQGGALSLLVANIVLNDVDRVLTDKDDPERLFIRYCDDMILLHTNYEECERLMKAYAKSLKEHGLYYHHFENVGNSKCQDSGNEEKTTARFWKIKSHRPYLWGDGEDNCNRYVGFLGYEIRRDGRMRLRKSNIKRFEEKYKRITYALKRYAKDHEPEEAREHAEKTLDHVLAGVRFYDAFDQELFEAGSQYRYLQKLQQRTKNKIDRKIDVIAAQQNTGG